MTAATCGPVSAYSAQPAGRPTAAATPDTGAHGAAVAEIAALLAKGLIRLHLAARNGLALCPESEPSCGGAAAGPEGTGAGRDGEPRP